ncbi:hypothetical protein D9M68_922990 [compost metagenome]
MAFAAAVAAGLPALLDRRGEDHPEVGCQRVQVASQVRVVAVQVEQLVVFGPTRDAGEIGIGQAALVAE